jgi:hypothetical protein
MAYHAGIWSEGDQVRPWINTIRELAILSSNIGGNTVLIDLNAYPARLVMYAFLLGAVVGNKLSSFSDVVCAQANFGRDFSASLGNQLNAGILTARGLGQGQFKFLPNLKYPQVAASEYIASLLRPIAKNQLLTDPLFDEAFAKIELSLAFGYVEKELVKLTNEDFFWSPPGMFCYQESITQKIVQDWRNDFALRDKLSNLSVMVGLIKPPQFDKVINFINEFKMFPHRH